MTRGADRIGTAGWSIPKQYAADFGDHGTHLQRYAGRFSGVEINSSFYRSHKPGTYARWAASVPAGFRFAVKAPREITHRRRLVDATEPLERFLSEVQALGGALGPLLVQLPPSLRFEEAAAETFLRALRARFARDVVWEPRHATWFADRAEALLSSHRIARVAADPAPVPRAAEPGGWAGIVYRRLHGSPRIYHSAYPPEYIGETARKLRDRPAGAGANWCIFDNTALGAATRDAMELQHRL